MKLGADDDASTLATQETLAKNLVYIMNIPEGNLLGQEHSHATEQSQGQSLATAQHDQNKCPKPSNETIRIWDEQPQEQPNVHAAMMPMSQPVGGWHVTSMTKHPDEQNVPRPCPLLVEPT